MKRAHLAACSAAGAPSSGLQQKYRGVIQLTWHDHSADKSYLLPPQQTTCHRAILTGKAIPNLKGNKCFQGNITQQESLKSAREHIGTHMLTRFAHNTCRSYPPTACYQLFTESNSMAIEKLPQHLFPTAAEFRVPTECSCSALALRRGIASVSPARLKGTKPFTTIWDLLLHTKSRQITERSLKKDISCFCQDCQGIFF